MMSKTVYMVVVHMPHKSIICPFSNRSDAYQYFCQLLLEVSQKYGLKDFNGASLEHCRRFGYYEIRHGYFIQLHEAVMDDCEKISWLDVSNWH